MYRDPEKLRRCRVPLNLTREENAYLEALADLTGAQKSVIARKMLLRQIRLAHQELLADLANLEVTQEG